MTLLASEFLTLKARLTRFKARFSLGVTLLFLSDSVNFCFLLAEILHQRNITRANPGAGTAFDTVCKIMRGGFIMLLAFAEPVELLGQ